MGLLLVYGLNTWLPKIMGEAGYSIKAGTRLLLVLNVGAVIGLLVAGGISDSRGNKPTVLLWFGLAAVFLALLSIKMEQHAAGVRRGAARRHLRVQRPGARLRLRRSPLPDRDPRHGPRHGGRRRPGRRDRRPVLGGALVTAGIAYPWGFYAFAVAALLAVVALSTVPAHMRQARATGGRGLTRRWLSRSHRFRSVEDGGMAGNVSRAGATVTSRALAWSAAYDAEHRRLSLTQLAERAGLPRARPRTGWWPSWSSGVR